MGLCWVTGVSGTGKSTIAAELRRLGELACDADDLAAWRDRTSGIVRPTPLTGVPDGWVDQHGWFIDLERVREFREQVADGVGFLAGAVENEGEVWDLFDAVVYLRADDDTITQRLRDRTTNDFGKSAEQLAMVLEWNALLEDQYRSAGATIVDATLPLAEVVAAVRAVAADAAN